MPTENEYKYVISLDFAQKPVSWEKKQFIKQGYLAFSKGMTTRIRRIEVEGKKPKWFLTFKQKVGDRVVEIENRIDKRDGVDLWEVCVGKLKKVRHICDDKGIKWEVDFFYKGTHLYFILAEVELPEGAPPPETLPEVFADHVVYEVRQDDERFSNKRLGDVDYATQMYRDIQD